MKIKRAVWWSGKLWYCFMDGGYVYCWSVVNRRWFKAYYQEAAIQSYCQAIAAGHVMNLQIKGEIKQ